MSFIDPVKIGNMALSNIGSAASIESLTEESAEAKQINLWYDFARQQCLAALDWNFARKRATLTTDADDPPSFDWNFRYQFPVDALAIRKLVNPVSKTDDAVPFELETNEAGTTKTIVTDMEDAIAVYTFDLTNTAMFSPLFVNAFSFLLAHYIALTLTGKKAIKDDAMQKYFITLRVAEALNANEHVSAPPREAEWIRARD